MVYQYGTLGQQPGQDLGPNPVQHIDATEQKLQPLLVLWLTMVANPAILPGAGPTEYELIGKALQLSPACVQAAFEFVRATDQKGNVLEAAKIFQSLARIKGGYNGGPGSPDCGSLTTISSLGQTPAIAAWSI